MTTLKSYKYSTFSHFLDIGVVLTSVQIQGSWGWKKGFDSWWGRVLSCFAFTAAPFYRMLLVYVCCWVSEGGSVTCVGVALYVQCKQSSELKAFIFHVVLELIRNLVARGDAREGKWRGIWRMEWVASTLTPPPNVVYPALLKLKRTPRLPAVDWTVAPTDLNGLVRFGERRNLVSARVPSRSARAILWYFLVCGAHFNPFFLLALQPIAGMYFAAL